MKVILREDVPHLGEVGDIVQVKPGYGRNYLIPQGLAVIADERNVRRIEHEKRLIQRRLQKTLGEAQARGQKLADLVITLPRKVGEQDKLYGSVTNRDIAEAIRAEGIEVDRKQIRLDHPIRELGVYKVQVRLHPQVTPEIKVWVVAE
ncbi:MAG: 50S ribosomal protein L9 [Deltaproteobacteria bacterium]|nr:MAG: 50S ribosomal protein L9 [Deltaproteobacteria bacterium]